MRDRGGYRRKREKKTENDSGSIDLKKKKTKHTANAPGKKIYHHGFDEYNKL